MLFAAAAFSGCASEKVPEYKEGTFVLGPIEGLTYRYGSIIGRTDETGRFYYIEGTPVSFSIEGVAIGDAALPKATVSPIDLIADPYAFVTDPKVTNLSRVLLSLDDDGNFTNGIRITEATAQAVKDAFPAAFINISGAEFESYSSLFPNGLATKEEGQAYLFLGLADQKALPVDLINLGDDFTGGTESSRLEISDMAATETINMHAATQSGSFAAFLAGQVNGVTEAEFGWHVPILDMGANRAKTRRLEGGAYIIPYNLAVHGATIKSLLSEKTGTGNGMLDELMRPVQTNWSTDVSQLHAARLVASQTGHEKRMKLFTLWIGLNDVLGSLTGGGGTKLTTADINAYLGDTTAGHDLTSVENNLDAVFAVLTAIPNSYVFVGNLPDATRLGALFYKEDIEALAPFDGAEVTALLNYTTASNDGDLVALGFEAFAAYTSNGTKGLFLNVTSNGTLNARIAALPDAYTLRKGEAALIRTRVNAINAHIAGLSAASRVFLVDLNMLFAKLDAGALGVSNSSGGTDYLSRRYGGGFFSLDGIRPSKTGHALIAKAFIDRIAHPFDPAHAVLANISSTDDTIGMKFDDETIDTAIKSLWTSESYRDRDGDGFPRGPGLTASGMETIDPELIFMRDCSDANAAVLPESLSGTACP